MARRATTLSSLLHRFMAYSTRPRDELTEADLPQTGRAPAKDQPSSTEATPVADEMSIGDVKEPPKKTIPVQVAIRCHIIIASF